MRSAGCSPPRSTALLALALMPAERRRARRARHLLPRPEPGRLPRVPELRPRARGLHEGLEPPDRGQRSRTRRCAARTTSCASKCRLDSIQTAVNRARNGYRIKVLPGDSTGRSAGMNNLPPGCEDEYQNTGALSYDQHRQCPNAQNLIAILGDTNGDRICDAKCNLQIEGTGDDPGDVKIEGQKLKLNVIRADRADGIYLKNFDRRVLRLQQHLRAGDERLPDRRDRLPLQPRVRDPLVRLRPRHLRELRRVVQRRLGRLPGLGPERAATASRTCTATCTGSRSATATRTTTRSACPARPATARGRTTTASATTRPVPRPTRSRAVTPACRRTIRSIRTT